MPRMLDLAELRERPEIGFYFRYPLKPEDFREIRCEGRLLGRYAAKPLYGRLTPEGKVDRSGGYNGQVAVLLLPPRARSARAAQILFTRVPKKQVTLANGRRNWTVIRAAAEQAVRRAHSCETL
jgi:hypothetical protein